ncbi:replication initiator protein A [Lactobacillus helveticus]|uniref:replication initiator protein A n=1 Tax=Lactobacillus helveticus TaxID=1587 RepID=UPI003D09EC0D
MYGEQYKHLSSDAKLAYMVLKDRLEYSLRNNWVDGGKSRLLYFYQSRINGLVQLLKGKSHQNKNRAGINRITRSETNWL